MIEDVRIAATRARKTLLRDVVGMTALGFAFYAVLHLPALLSAV